MLVLKNEMHVFNNFLVMQFLINAHVAVDNISFLIVYIFFKFRDFDTKFLRHGILMS